MKVTINVGTLACSRTQVTNLTLIESSTAFLRGSSKIEEGNVYIDHHVR